VSAYRGECALQPVDHQLEQALRLGQVLELVGACVPKREVRAAVAFDEALGVFGDEHLTAVRCGGDPRGAMHVDAEVMGVGNQRLARVHAHSHPHRDLARPGMRGEPRLDFRRCLDSRGRLGERDEETVPLRIDLDSIVVRDRLTHDPAVGGHDIRIGVAEIVEQTRRPFDVSE
jgi:hypothetical protein